jgi:predicted ATPase
MIQKINFRNYKSFRDPQSLFIKPMTIILGKNSSGKSAVVKLPTLVEGSLSGDFQDPVMVTNQGVELGAEFRDLIYGRNVGSLNLTLEQSGNVLEVEIASGLRDSDLPKIRNWNYNNGSLEFRYDDKNDNYKNNESNKEIRFNGFNLDQSFVKEQSLEIEKFVLNTNYIGPFREIPKRTYISRGNLRNQNIGNKGEFTYQILISDYLYNESKLLNKVSDWYQDNFDGWGVRVNSNAKPDYKVELFRENPSFNINIRDVGEGMSQVLPIVVSAFIENNQDIIYIMEQPELHLHPGAHGNLAELLVKQASAKNKNFLIETHSQNFILRIRRLIAENKIEPKVVGLYFVDFDSIENTSNLKEIKIDEKGNVDYWPSNIFNEALDEAIAIHSAQKNRG